MCVSWSGTGCPRSLEQFPGGGLFWLRAVLLGCDFSTVIPCWFGLAWLGFVAVLFTPRSRCSAGNAAIVDAIVRTASDTWQSTPLLVWAGYTLIGPWFVGTFVADRWGLLFLWGIVLVDGPVLYYHADIFFFALQQLVRAWLLLCLLVGAAFLEKRLSALKGPLSPWTPRLWLTGATALSAVFLWFQVVGTQVWALNYSWTSVWCSPGVYWFTALSAVQLMRRIWLTHRFIADLMSGRCV
jgi:hypothetical protein